MQFTKTIILILFFRIALFFQRNKIIILMLHGVMDESVAGDWEPLRSQLSPKLLDRYLSTLSKHYNFISFDQAVQMINKKIPLQPHSLVFTFDDGLRNFKDHALPVLRKYKVPATAYVATGHVEYQIPYWFDRLDYALQLLEGEPYTVEMDDEVTTFIPGDREALSASYKKLRDMVKKKQMPDEEMQDFFYSTAESIEKKYGKSLQDIFANDPWSGIMNWDELRDVTKEGVVVGSHTVTHHRLSLLAEEKVEQELLESKQAIESHVDKRCKHFCYPNGSYNEQVAGQVKRAGYLSAVTTESGFNEAGDDPMQLRRFHVPYGAGGEGVSDLLYRISGLEAFFSHVKKSLNIVIRKN